MLFIVGHRGRHVRTHDVLVQAWRKPTEANLDKHRVKNLNVDVVASLGYAFRCCETRSGAQHRRDVPTHLTSRLLTYLAATHSTTYLPILTYPTYPPAYLPYVRDGRNENWNVPIISCSVVVFSVSATARRYIVILPLTVKFFRVHTRNRFESKSNQTAGNAWSADRSEKQYRSVLFARALRKVYFPTTALPYFHVRYIVLGTKRAPSYNVSLLLLLWNLKRIFGIWKVRRSSVMPVCADGGLRRKRLNATRRRFNSTKSHLNSRTWGPHESSTRK